MLFSLVEDHPDAADILHDAVCAVPLADGRTVLACASRDGTVRLWNPTAGQQIGEPLTGHTNRVTAVCAVPLADGRTLLATGSDDCAILVWKPGADLMAIPG